MAESTRHPLAGRVTSGEKYRNSRLFLGRDSGYVRGACRRYNDRESGVGNGANRHRLLTQNRDWSAIMGYGRSYQRIAPGSNSARSCRHRQWRQNYGQVWSI